jgi:hypothetical protein
MFDDLKEKIRESDQKSSGLQEATTLSPQVIEKLTQKVLIQKIVRLNSYSQKF